jgi:hypothetical protein
MERNSWIVDTWGGESTEFDGFGDGLNMNVREGKKPRMVPGFCPKWASGDAEKEDCEWNVCGEWGGKPGMVLKSITPVLRGLRWEDHEFKAS